MTIQEWRKMEAAKEVQLAKRVAALKRAGFRVIVGANGSLRVAP